MTSKQKFALLLVSLLSINAIFFGWLVIGRQKSGTNTAAGNNTAEAPGNVQEQGIIPVASPQLPPDQKPVLSASVPSKIPDTTYTVTYTCQGGEGQTCELFTAPSGGKDPVVPQGEKTLSFADGSYAAQWMVEVPGGRQPPPAKVITSQAGKQVGQAAYMP